MGDASGAVELDWWTTERGLLPNLIRNEKLHEPNPYLVIASPEGIVHEYTFADFENASNRAAWMLSKTMPADEERFLYMGRMDMRYFIWMLAAMKVGKCVVFPSPSNTVAANQLLFRDVGAKTMLYSPESFDLLEGLHGATQDTTRWVRTQSYEDMLSRKAADVFPFTSTFEEVRDKPFMGLHTSGTTGHPKPIYWTHATVAVMRSHTDRSLRERDAPEETQYQQMFNNKRYLLPFPFYHAGGMLSFFAGIVCGSKSLLAPVPGMPLTAENVTGLLKAARPETGLFPPAVVENMLKHPRGLEAMRRIHSTITVVPTMVARTFRWMGKRE